VAAPRGAALAAEPPPVAEGPPSSQPAIAKIETNAGATTRPAEDVVPRMQVPPRAVDSSPSVRL
jgi:hypothetical protein